MKTVIAVMGLLLVSSLVSGGNLNPPAAPAPTMKTLDEVEPRIPVGTTTTPGDAEYEYIISASGSYYLTGNIAASKGGIKIASNDVTLDLSGYTLSGPNTQGKDNNYGIYLAGYNLVDQNTAYLNGTGAAGATNMDTHVAGCVYGANVAP